MATITMYRDINVDDAFSPTFVAVVYGTTGGASATDTSTGTWTARTLPSASNWNSVAYGNKMIVAVSGSTTAAASSPDGITWTARTMSASATWQSVIYGGTRFVAVANGSTNSAYSTDGITWSAGGVLPSAAAWFCVAYGESTYVAVATTSSTAAAYSTNGGTSWTAGTLPASGNWQSVCYGNGKFVAVSYGGTATAVSDDGITWVSGGAMPNTRNWSSVTWGNPGGTANGIFVAVSYGNAVGAISTDNGTTWTEVYLAPEMVVNGSFTGNADFWTLGAGWSYGTNNVTHTSGTATVVPNPALSIVASTMYQVTYTMSGRTVGSVTVSIGGTNGTARSSNATFTEVLTTTTTANLTFTPTTDFDGAIDDISVRYVANWNCISYGESSAQGVKVFTVTSYGQGFNTVSFDGTNWFVKTMVSASNWKYHCYAPVVWNSNDTLVINNNATVTVNTNQTKFWKTITGTYGTLKIINTSTSSAINFFMGRSSGATVNAITPGSGAFGIDIDGDWIQVGTGNGSAAQTFTVPYSEYVPSVWVETGSGTGVYEIWNNVTGAIGPYMTMFGRDGLGWVGSGKRGNYFIQSAAANPIAIYSLTSGANTNGSYFVTCASTTGVYPGGLITGTGIGASAVINRVVDSTTLELNVVSTSTNSGLTFTVYNPMQAQFTTTIVVGNGTNGNMVPSGAKVRIPNIMFSDNTSAFLKTASYLVDASISMINGGYIDARICLFGDVYADLLQSASIYFRNVAFDYQFTLAECYAVDMDGVGCAASPCVWYYSAKWILRDNRYGVLAPLGWTTPTGSNNVAITYIHNAVIKNWHKVTYCTAYFSGATVTMPVDLADTEDATFENIRLVTLNATRQIRNLNISARVNRCTFTNLELYGAPPLLLGTSNNNTFAGIEYALTMNRPILAFKSSMRLYELADGTPLADNVPVYIKTRTFNTWNSRDALTSGEYSATPFQNNWLFPDTLSVRPTEATPASVTFNWTQREPSSATTLAYEIFRSTSAGFTTRTTATSVFRVATAATVTFVNGPRTTIIASAGRTLTFNVAKTITASTGSYITDGYAVGDVVDVTGTTANNGTYTINTLTALVMTVNENLVTEAAYSSVATITGKAPVVDTKYYYRMRKFHSSTAHVNCSVQTGTATMTTSSINPSWNFDKLYALTEFYYDSGSTVIRTRKTNLFATPFYKGAVVTGANIPAGTTILNIDAAGRELVLSQATTGSGTNATVTLPVQAGMAVTWQISKPGAGLPYGTTVQSVESATSLTLSQNVTSDIGYVTNGSFTGSATGWTLGAGWTYGSNAVSHSSGTATLTQTSMTVVIGGVYTVIYTISGMSAGSVTVSIGGASGTSRTANGTYTEALTATTTGTLTFTPVTGFNGTIDDVYAGVTLNFLPMTESPELVVTPHDYTSVTNYCLQSRTLATTWVSSGVTATNANTYAAPSETTWSATATATRLVSSTTPGTVTQSITGLTVSTVYSASIWVRADQDATNPSGIAGSLQWGTVTTPFTATNGWTKVECNNFTATATSHNLIVTITTTGKTIWAADAMVNVGTSTTSALTTTTAAVTLKPVAYPITTLYSYARPSDMTGSTGHQGIHVTLGTAPSGHGQYYHEIYMSTTSGFTPSDSNLVARTWALADLAPFNIATSMDNNFSNIVKLAGGGSSSTATTGIFYLTANSNNNAFVNCDIDYCYCNTTAIPALHLVTPSQNNVFHNIDFGRNGNYLALPGLWHNTAVNSVTDNRLQNIYADHYDLPLNNLTLDCNVKGVAAGNSWPTAALSTFAIGNTIDGIDVTKTACYGSMFNEHFRGVSANLLPNGTFTGSATGWTLGSGWSYSSNAVVHSSGTATLTPSPAMTVVAGHEYEVTFTISGATTGNVTASIGGVSGTARSTNGIFTEKLTATATTNLTFTPTTDFNGTLDSISFGESIGALHVIFEDTQGVKPYTTTGSPKFSNTGRLYLPTTADTVTLTWPYKIKGVTGFRNMVPRFLGLDFGNNNNLLDGLKTEYKIDSGTFKRLTPANLISEGTLDAVNGFDLSLKFTPLTHMKFSTQTTGTYTSHTAASPGVITTGATAWATGQVVRYTTTGDPFGGLTADTNYYLIVVSTTTFQLATTPGGSGITLTSATGSGVHTFNVNFVVGETILGATSFATAVVDEVYYDSVNAGTLVVSSVSGSWVAGENIRTAANTATKALNVATNSFAFGPSYTSYINALEIMTFTNRTKLYDAAIVTVTLTNIVPNSMYYIYNSSTLALVAQGTATGTPGPGETTINYNVSVVYETDFDITVNVRKSSAPTKYLPYETGSTVTSNGANVFIAQVVDTVILSSYAAIAADWTIDVTYETIKHTSGTTVYTVNHLYSYLLDYFDELGYLDDQIPMSASTPTEYNLINGWFIDDESFKYLSGGAVTTIGQNAEVYTLTLSATGYTSAVSGDLTRLVTNGAATHTGRLLAYDNTRRIWWIKKVLSTFTAEAVTITGGIGAGTITSVATGESIWSNIYTLGTIVSGTTLDVYQNDTNITPWWSTNHIDVLIKVKESGTEIDSGNLTVLARIYGSLYDHFVIDASSGRNPVPLAAFTDGNNTTAEGTVGAYSGITFSFGYSSHDLGSGAAPYDVEINGGGNTLLQIYEYLKYVTRTGSTTTFTGYGTIPGEYYIATGDVRFNYDNEAVANFSQGERINGTGGTYGYLVSLLDSGTTGTMVLRNVHGTFSDNMSLTGVTSTATALVNGTVTSITPSKTAPFGTYAGGTFFGARGVWLYNMASADANNYQLIDSTGTTQTPPTTIPVTVNGVEIGDKVSVFRATDTSGNINRTYMTSHDTNNPANNSTFEVNAVPADTPNSGRLRIRNQAGTTEYHIRYSSRTSTVFTLRTAITGTINAVEDVTGTSFTANSTSFSSIEPGDMIRNTSDGSPGSWAQIITVTSLGGNDYRFTHTPLTGGTDNQWNTGDGYSFHTLPIGFNNTFTAYVPYIDAIAASTSVSVNVTYVANRNISTQVRRKGILPFSTNAVSLTSAGYTATAVRTVDTIVT